METQFKFEKADLEKNRRLLLVSDGSMGKTKKFLKLVGKQQGKEIKEVLFFPWAHADLDGYEESMQSIFGWRFADRDVRIVSIHRFKDPIEAIMNAQAFYVGGGNTFRLLKKMYETGVMPAMRARIAQGVPYIGTSAGTNVATVSINTTNDMPIVWPPSLDALDLVPFNINPHFFDTDPARNHRGETRVQRLREFHEESDNPVIGLREGAMLWIEGDKMTLRGEGGAKLFLKGAPRYYECEIGSDLSYLLSGNPKAPSDNNNHQESREGGEGEAEEGEEEQSFLSAGLGQSG